MKRFLKIFAICFGGLIGVFGATYGALTLFGYFDVPAIYPENIAFEIQKNNLYTNADNNEIFASFSPEDDGFYVTITTTTENVTKKEIQLSLEGVDSGEGSLGNGKISDGVITIPEKVIIGERFLVEPTRKNQTLGFGENQISLDWIIGGHSVIKSKSLDNLALTSKTLKVHIDVPVYDIKTIAVATETDAQASTEFSIGTNFKIDAEFSPANSKYYFAMDGQDGYEEILKKIYVDENSEQRNDIFKRISDDNLSQNIFTALKETKLNKANLTAYCFQNSYEQYRAENFLAGINTDDDIYKAIRDDLITGDSNSLAKFNEVRLDFKKVTDLTYVITNNSSASYKVNNIFTWFVNYQDSSLYSKNLEIIFQSLYSTLDLQSEVKKLGIQILKGDNDSFVYDANLIPYRYGDVKYLAYYSIKKGEEYITYQQYLELELTDQEICDVQFVNENTYQDMSVADKNLYREIVLSQEDYDNFKLKVEFKEKFSCFYFPYLNKNNIDLSFWQFEFNNARNYKIRFKYFSSDDEIIIEDKFIELNIETIISGEVDFINNEPIELKIDYSKNNDVYLGNIKEYDVSKYLGNSNISIPSTNEYTTVRYFVFVEDGTFEENDSLTNYIECTKTVNKKGYGINLVDLYELPNGILKFKSENVEKIKNKNFYLCFATVKTKNGSVIFNPETGYEFDQQSRRNILVKIQDTLKDILVVADINTDLQNIDYFNTEVDDIAQISFLQNKQNIMSIAISPIDETQFDLLKKEIENGNIKINAYNGDTNLTDQVIGMSHSEMDIADNKLIIYKLSTKILTGNDQTFNLRVNYLVNGNTYEIKIGEITQFEVFSGEATDIHFGKESVLGEISSNYGEIIKTERENGNPIDVSKVFKEENGETIINVSYKLLNNLKEEILRESEIKSFLFDEEGNLQFTFNDKYGRNLDNGNFILQSSDTSVVIVSNNNFNFVKAGTCELKLIIDNEVKDILLLKYSENNAEIDNISVNSQTGIKDIYTNNPENQYDFSKAIETSFVGYKGNILYFEETATEKGLLQLLYRQPKNTEQAVEREDEYDIFNFSNKVKYTFESAIDTDLLEMLNITYSDEENGEISSITISNEFYSSARIRIKAKIAILNLEQIIELYIQPNVTINYDIDYQYSDAESITNGINTYIGVYGETQIKITLVVSYEKGGDGYKLYDQANSEISAEVGNLNTYIYLHTFAEVNNYQQTELKIKDSIGESQNKYRFNIVLYYYINPNIKVNAVNSVKINGNNEISLFATNENKNAIEVTKISDNTIIDTNKLTVIGEIKDGVFIELGSNSSFTYNRNILTLNQTSGENRKLKIVLGSLLNSSIDAVNFKKGCSKIEIGGNTYYYVEIEILPFITLDLTTEHFINYGGLYYLELVSGNTYAYTDLATYFIADTGWDIAIEGVEQDFISTAFDINDNKIIVSEIYDIQGINECYFLKVKTTKDNKSHTLNVPILFVPIELPFTDKNYLGNTNTEDYKNLLNVSWLKENQYVLNLEIIAGDRIELSEIFNFELEKFSYNVINEDETLNRYANVEIINGEDSAGQAITTYILNTELVDADKIVYINARRKVLGSSSAKVIEIPIRLKITNGLNLNVHYLYGGNAEYIVLNGTKAIDMMETLSTYIPNKSMESTRFELINKNSQNNDINTLNTKYSYTFDFNVQNGSLAKDLYGSINNSVLTLNKVSETDYSIVVTISILNASGTKVLSKDYVFTVIDPKVFNLTATKTDFLINSNSILEIKIPEEFYLTEEKSGMIIQQANDKLNFYVANGQGVVYAEKINNVWSIVAGNAVLDINATLVAYTEYGELNRYPIKVNSGKTIILNDIDGSIVEGINSDSTTTAELKVDTQIVTITNIDILEVKNDNSIVANIEENGKIAKFTDIFGNVSTIKIVENNGDFDIDISPFTENVFVKFNIEFTFENKSWNWEGSIKCFKTLSSNIPTVDNLGNAVEKVAGTDLENLTSELFDGDVQNYALSIEAIENANLVDINGENVRFKSSANGGIVVLKYIYTHKTHKNDNLTDFVVIAYKNFNVSANVSYTLNYPFGVEKECLPSGSTGISLFDNHIMGQPRLKVTSSDGKTVGFEIIRQDGAVAEIGASNDITFNLESGYNIGYVSIGITYGGDLITYYNIEVRKTWSDILKSNLLNIDGSTNSLTNPEIYLNNTNYENGVVLDVADYDKNKYVDLIKKLVLGYNEEENIFTGKSTFNYYVDSTYQPQIDTTVLVFNDKILETENENSSTVEISVSFNGIGICKYYVLFEFNVQFNQTTYTINPGEKNNVKDMFGIICNEDYSVSLAETTNGGNTFIDYNIYTVDSDEPCNQYKGYDCITFENNKVNPEVAGWGSPNAGLKFQYKIIISYKDKFSKEQIVTTYIYPNYIVEHDSSLKITDDMFNGHNQYIFPLATLDLNNSLIKVYTSKEQENLLVKYPSIWNNIESSNQEVVETSSISRVSTLLQATAKKSTFGIKETIITFADKYGYSFEYSISVVPTSVNIPKFSSSSIVMYEGEILNVASHISNISLIDINNSKSTVSLKIENEEYTTTGASVLENFVVETVFDTTVSGTLYVKIYNLTGDDSTTISVPITIMKRYSLSINEKYLKDGAIYLKENEKLSLYDLFYIHDGKELVRAGERSLTNTKSLYFANANLDNSSIIALQSKNMTTIFNGQQLVENSTYKNNKTYINLGEYLVAGSLSEDVTNYIFVVSIGNKGEENISSYSNTLIYGNSNPTEIKYSNGKYFLEMSCGINDKVIIRAFEINNTTYHYFNDISMYKKGTLEEYYIPFTKLSDFSYANADEYNYYIISNIANSSNQIAMTSLDKDASNNSLMYLVDDKILKVSGVKDKDITIYFNNGLYKSIPNTEINFSQSLRLFLTSDEYSQNADWQLRNGIDEYKTYIDGIELSSLAQLKGFSVDVFDGNVYVSKSELSPKIENGLVMNSYPYYEQSQYKIKLTYKSAYIFDTSIIIRTIPPIVYLTNNDNTVTWGENGKLNVSIGKIVIDNNIIEKDAWTTKVNVLDENQEFVSNLKEFLQTNTINISYSVKEGDTAKGQINQDGIVELSNEFDFVSGHITIIITISGKNSNGEEVYSLPIAEIVMLPRKS